MKVVTIKQLKESDYLKRPFYHKNGEVMIEAGIPLFETEKNQLTQLGISYVGLSDSKEVLVPWIATVKRECDMLIDILDHYSPEGEHFHQLIQSARMIISDIRENDEAISLLADAYRYDSYIFIHSVQVTLYALSAALELNFLERDLLNLGYGALFHDIGKLAIPEQILQKPSSLTDQEYEVVQQHTQAGYDLLYNMPSIPVRAKMCALQHHERIDGTGYPLGLTGNQIDDYAKIVSVADVFDAITANRVYRKGLSVDEGFELLEDGAGQAFDREVVKAFISKPSARLATQLSELSVEQYQSNNKKTHGYEVDLLDIYRNHMKKKWGF